ncbi:hypothetical protein L3Y34_012338 [Caenorhabditis briggsae]|uniref:Uncharacterized protein n=2 Tax=Caenorhabditis briggsae TaxID=6238 RepID=A0AAE9CWH4_CAEBR|nr:hypothetical protein L3Y34_012338 [Caenorhabditis briggsae]
MGIQLSVEMEHREIRTVYDVQLAPKSHRSVEVRVAGIFDTEKFCLVHSIIDQLALTVCQVDTKGKTFLMLSNRGKVVVFLGKGQLIAHGELDKTEVFENKLFSEDSAEHSCPVSDESLQKNSVTDSQCDENQSDVVDSSTPFNLLVTKARDKQELIDSSRLYEDDQNEHHELEIVPESLKPPPEPILEKGGDVALGGVFRTKPTCRVKENNSLRKGLGIQSPVYQSNSVACEKELLSQNSHHNNLIQDHPAHANETSPKGTRIFLSPGKDPPPKSNRTMSCEHLPKDSKEFFEDSYLPKFAPSLEPWDLPYGPGSSMIFHPMPSTTTDADADISGSSSPRVSSYFQHG